MAREEDDRDFYDKAIEREADRFAAAFLIPIPSLCAELAAAASGAGLDVHDLLRGVRRGEAPHRLAFRTRVLSTLARRFGVSLTAAAYRFSDIELATGDVAVPFEAVLSMLSNIPAQEALRRQ